MQFALRTPLQTRWEELLKTERSIQDAVSRLKVGSDSKYWWPSDVDADDDEGTLTQRQETDDADHLKEWFERDVVPSGDGLLRVEPPG